MKRLIVFASICFICFCPGIALGFDCSEIREQIEQNKGHEDQLKKLSKQYPKCGDIWKALGDYYYDRKMWEDAEKSYERGEKLLPNDKVLAARLKEARLRQTSVVKNEQELLLYRRGIGGTTSAGPGLPHTLSPVLNEKPTAESPRAAGAETVRQPNQLLSKQAEPAESSRKKRVKRTSPRHEAAELQPPPKSGNVSLLIQFDYNSATIRLEGEKLLDGFADMLNQEYAGRKFYVQGHTDNIGGPDYNMSLSRDRASSVKDYLSHKGVDAGRLEIQGFGFQKPIMDNDTEEGRSMNRRVDFKEILK